jgi:hypothetical protein
MTEQSPNPGAHLTDSQTTRMDGARRDLDYVRSEDMDRLDAAGLILLVERLRGRLDDMLHLLNEVTPPD